MKKYLLIFTYLLINLFLNAQVNKYGYPLYTYYGPDEIGSNDQNWNVVQSPLGFIYVANNLNGVLEYDGENWKSIAVSDEIDVRSLAVNKDGIVFLGGSGEFGCLLSTTYGKLEYKSLSSNLPDTLKGFNVWNVFCQDDTVYFSASNEKLFKYIFPNDSLIQISLPKHTFKSFYLNDNIYCASIATGLYKIQDTTYSLVKNGNFFAEKDVFEVLSDFLNDYVVTGKAGIFKSNFDSGVFTNVLKTKAFNYLKDVYTYSAYKNKDNFILGTLGKGLIIINNNGSIDAILDKEIGIQDHYSLNVNQYNNNIWTTLSFGISSVEFNNPIRIFSEESKLEGYINVIYKFKNTLYIGTDVGLFYLKFDVFGLPSFIKVDGIDDQVFSIAKIVDQKTKKEILIVGGTTQGLFEVDPVYKKAKSLESRIRNLKKVFSRIDENKLKNVKIKVFKLLTSHDGRMWINDRKSLFCLELNNNEFNIAHDNFLINEILNSLIEDEFGNIWGATNANGIVQISNPSKGGSIKWYNESKGLPGKSTLRVSKFRNDVFVNSNKGIFKYNNANDEFNLSIIIPDKQNVSVSRFVPLANGSFIINAKEDDNFNLMQYQPNKNTFELKETYFNRIKNFEIEYIFEDTTENILWIASANKLYTYNLNTTFKPNDKFNAFVRKVQGVDTIYFYGTFNGEYKKSVDGYYPSKKQSGLQKPIIDYTHNDLTFHFAAPYFEAPEEIEYSYNLEGFKKDWSKWNKESKAVFTNINQGEYTFKVKAKNVYGIESSVGEYSFTILPPWYRTIVAYFLYVLVGLILIWVIVKLYTRKLQQEKIMLEKIVRERTAEIREQRDQIAGQKQSIEDSIQYASRIQRAILPSTELANDILPEYFILFRPRDIVSGDYYWMNRIANKTILVAADCTGHGVPGAFMSMLGVSFLNEIVIKEQVLEPHEILNKLRQRVKKTLKQEGKDGEAKDGMDVAIVVIDDEKKKLYFSGAYNPVYIYRNNELIEIKADRMPIGIYIREKESFTLNEFDYQKGDTFYIFSDGYPDQFGGEKGQKFRSKAMKQLMLDIQPKSMCEQRDILNTTIEDWMGEQEQIDDMVIIGVRL
ncbi:MAG: SpoIIE family protein phosphatase [Salinivirgaceae bacterium]|nr:SpoIIE family protein phosphatase [Salinivirgaceae bacterium]